MDTLDLEERILNTTTEDDVLKYITTQLRGKVDAALQEKPEQYIFVRVCSGEELTEIKEKNVNALGTKSTYADDPHENSDGRMFFFNVDKFDNKGENSTEDFEESVSQIYKLIKDIHNKRSNENLEKASDFANSGIAVMMLDKPMVKRLLENGQMSFNKVGVYAVPGERATMTMRESTISPEALRETSNVFTANNFYSEIYRTRNGDNYTEPSQSLVEFLKDKKQLARKAQTESSVRLSQKEKDSLEQIRALIEGTGVQAVYEYLDYLLDFTPKVLNLLLSDKTLDSNNAKLQKYAKARFGMDLSTMSSSKKDEKTNEDTGM